VKLEIYEHLLAINAGFDQVIRGLAALRKHDSFLGREFDRCSELSPRKPGQQRARTWSEYGSSAKRAKRAGASGTAGYESNRKNQPRAGPCRVSNRLALDTNWWLLGRGGVFHRRSSVWPPPTPGRKSFDFSPRECERLDLLKGSVQEV